MTPNYVYEIELVRIFADPIFHLPKHLMYYSHAQLQIFRNDIILSTLVSDSTS